MKQRVKFLLISLLALSLFATGCSQANNDPQRNPGSTGSGGGAENSGGGTNSGSTGGNSGTGH